MVRLRYPAIPLLLSFSVLLVTYTSNGVSASNHIQAQHPFKRHEDAANVPHVDFAVDPLNPGPPALVKTEYNQFGPSPPSKHDKDGEKKKEKEVTRKKFLHWMHKIGLHPTKQQTDQLYGLVKSEQSGKGKHKKHHKGEGDKEKAKSEGQKPAWKEVTPPPPSPSDHEAGNDKKPKVFKPLPAHLGILPPGLGKPRGWGDESQPNPPSSASRSSSPVIAAQPPLPEPANTFSPPTASLANSKSSILQPLPAEGDIGKNTSSSILAPVTSLPSSTPSDAKTAGSETTGSLNPSSTPPPPPFPATPSKSGKSIAGVPIVDDDDDKSSGTEGDVKVPKPNSVNITASTPTNSSDNGAKSGPAGSATGGSKEAKSGATKLNHPQEGVWGWIESASLAAIVVGVLFFAI